MQAQAQDAQRAADVVTAEGFVGGDGTGWRSGRAENGNQESVSPSPNLTVEDRTLSPVFENRKL